MTMSKFKFSSGVRAKEYYVINIVSIKQNQAYELKYLDMVEGVTTAVATHITKIKKILQKIEIKKK